MPASSGQLRHQVQALAVAPHFAFRMRHQRLRILACRQHLRHHLRQQGGGRHGQAALGEPVAQQVVDAVQAEGAQARQVEAVAVQRGRQILGRQLAQEALGRLHVGAGTHDALFEAGEGARQHRHHLVAQGVAGVAGVGVRFVLDPADTFLRRKGFQVGACLRQQRTRHHQLLVAEQARCAVGRIHAGQAGGAGAAQQLQQHGLGLVVEVVGGQQEVDAVAAAHRAEGGVAQLARGRFDAAPALLDHDGALVEGRAKSGGRRGAMRGPGIGVGAEAMMDVEGEQGTARMRGRKTQQHHRIEAAAEGDRDARRRCGEVFGAQRLEGLRKGRRQFGGGRTGRRARSCVMLDHSSRGRVSLNFP
jgi:hypothetical protein